MVGKPMGYAHATWGANGHLSGLKDTAWYYPTTKEKAKPMEGYVAFQGGVRVEV